MSREELVSSFIGIIILIAIVTIGFAILITKFYNDIHDCTKHIELQTKLIFKNVDDIKTSLAKSNIKIDTDQPSCSYCLNWHKENGMYIMSNYKSDPSLKYMTMQYCPKCGRKLTDNSLYNMKAEDKVE